jgi:hypothetical protein
MTDGRAAENKQKGDAIAPQNEAKGEIGISLKC